MLLHVSVDEIMACHYYDSKNNKCGLMKDKWTGLGTHTPTPEKAKDFCSTNNYEKCDRYKPKGYGVI